jgi:hypothetical protein
LPLGTTALVVSKGDEELVKLEGRTAWHFPRHESGVYAGHYPANSAEAIRHLEALRGLGARYLLFPSTAFWWLVHYEGLRHHLDQHYPRVMSDSHCLIYRLVRPEARLWRGVVQRIVGKA